jgi:hypothetical protein
MVTLAARVRRTTSELGWHALALAVFATGAALLWHPLLAGGLANFSIGTGESNDPQIFIWGLAWYPYALRHGLDPLYTTLVFAPSGYNLAWSTTLPAPALALWPVTARFGPLVAFNLMSVLIPLLSAYTAFALCRHVSQSPPASIAGGLVYGFSTYQRIEVDHPNLAMSFIVPLLVLLFLLRMEKRFGAIRYALLMAVALTIQFLISPEIFAIAIFFGASTIALAAWMGGSSFRTRLRMPLGESVAAIAIAVAVLSPYIFRFFPSPFGLSPIYNPAHCSSDLAGFVLPTEASLASRLTLFRRLGSHIGFGCEPAAYMGLLPLIGVWAGLRPRRHPAADAFPTDRFLLALLGGILLFALGPVIHVGGKAVAPSIWFPAMVIPILNNALPARFVLFAFLILSITMARWLSDLRRRAAARWLIAALAIGSVLPTTVAAENVTLPFFSQRMYREYLAPHETVMFLPFAYNGPAMKWQAQSGFFFRVAGGYLSVIPHEYEGWPIVTALLPEAPYIPDFGDQFKAFIAAHGVRAVIVAEGDYDRYAKLCATLGESPVHAGGVVIFRPSAASLANFSHATAAEMDTRYNLARFELLIDAARDYLARGYPAAELSPSAVERLGLIDATLAGDPARSQTAGFPFASSAAFQAVARMLISRHLIRERLAVELGPVPSGEEVTRGGIWLGPWSDGTIAVGVVTGPQAAASLRARFGPQAGAVYYPYPLPYSAQPESINDQQMLLMAFKPAALAAIR